MEEDAQQVGKISGKKRTFVDLDGGKIMSGQYQMGRGGRDIYRMSLNGLQKNLNRDNCHEAQQQHQRGLPNINLIWERGCMNPEGWVYHDGKIEEEKLE